jgi:hypothetical protein
LIGKLFGTTPADAGMETRPTATPASTPASGPTQGRPTIAATAPNPSYGRAPRIVGTIMLITGGGLALLGGLFGSMVSECVETYDIYGYSASDVDCSLNAVYGVYSTLFVIGGVVVSGIGAKVRANGVARRDVGDPEISGRPGAYWLGWLLGAAAMATPVLGVAGVFDLGTAKLFGWGTGLGSLATFFIGSFAAVQPASYAALVPEPTMGLAREADGGVVPTFGLGLDF